MADSDLEMRLAWQRWLGRSAAAEEWYESVLARHREPHRYYHDVRHVRWVVRQVQELSADRAVTDVAELVAAAFFHDVVYDPTATNNEEASADLAGRALPELGWAATSTTRVRVLIEGTQHHVAKTLDEAVLFAADLSVLAADAARYADYVRNVRREYVHVSDDGWATGRRAVLEAFMARPAIYAPELQLDTWEHRARANLTAELATL